MSKAKTKERVSGPIDPAKLKAYVERIEAVESEEADYKSAKKDIYVEVKAAGMRPKMVRKIVKERKKTDADAEEEQELALYRAALAMPGATFRSVSKDLGVPRSTLHRLVPRNKNGTKPEDGDDGITESCGGVESRHAEGPQGRSCEHEPTGHASTSGQASAAGVAPGPHDTHPGGGILCPLCLQDEHDSDCANAPPAPPSVGAVAAEPRVAHHDDHDDDLSIPAHLRGPSPANRRLGT